MIAHPIGAVIVSEAKQSSLLPERVDCFIASLLAMTPLVMNLRTGGIQGVRFVDRLEAVIRDDRRRSRSSL
jgi:hypothetical protein